MPGPSLKRFATALCCCIGHAAHSQTLSGGDTSYNWMVTCLLLIVIGLQFWLQIRARRKARKPTVSDYHLDEQDSLQNTRHRLYREIARHEATEELLLETQEYLNCMINSMPTVLIGITPNGFVTQWNYSAEKVAGLSSDEAVGSHINQAFPDLPITMEMVSETIQSGIPYSQENIKDGSGSQATFTNLTLYPLVSDDLVGAVIMAEDVTPRVRMENLLIQNEKMMSLGELAAGVAHEINNPLAAILSNTQNIMRRTSPDLPSNYSAAEELDADLEDILAYLAKREVPSFLHNIRDAGERAANIVNNLLEFSRGSDRNQQVTDLAVVIQNTLELAHNNFELPTMYDVKLPNISAEYGDNIKPVYCSAPEIQQVLLNLLRNAAQAIKSEENHSRPPAITIKLYEADNFAVIEVADNGPGMPDEVLKHIFEPFYTTKMVGKGTGLGLSVSYFIVKEHHQGSIEAESQVGKGTTFRIKLPYYCG